MKDKEKGKRMFESEEVYGEWELGKRVKNKIVVILQKRKKWGVRRGKRGISWAFKIFKMNLWSSKEINSPNLYEV